MHIIINNLLGELAIDTGVSEKYLGVYERKFSQTYENYFSEFLLLGLAMLENHEAIALLLHRWRTFKLTAFPHSTLIVNKQHKEKKQWQLHHFRS